MGLIDRVIISPHGPGSSSNTNPKWGLERCHDSLASFNSANAAACSSLLALPFFFFCFFFNLGWHDLATLSQCSLLISLNSSASTILYYPPLLNCADGAWHQLLPSNCFLSSPKRSRSCAFGTAGSTKLSRSRWSAIMTSSLMRLGCQNGMQRQIFRTNQLTRYHFYTREIL